MSPLIKYYKPVSRILLLRYARKDEHRKSTLLLGSICLPSIIERAVLRRWFMWHFSMQGLPANNVTIISRELLPHVFNLTPAFSTSGEGEAVIFCGTVCCPVFTAAPGSSPVHCSVLSGLSSPSCDRAITRLVAIISKKRLQK